MLVLPSGTVTAFEIDERLADLARRNLAPMEGVTVVNGDATAQPLPKSDVIYVNAGVAAPPVDWLDALNPGGRLILPWRPSEEIAETLLIKAEAGGFTVTPLMRAWFIPCVGASDEVKPLRLPQSADEVRALRSIWRTTDRTPDATASRRASDSTLPICVLPPWQSILLISRASWAESEIQPVARHSFRPR